MAKILSAGIVPVSAALGSKVLLLRAYRNWDFPKGIVEKGETPEAAAERELWEETGLTVTQWLVEGRFVETLPYARGKVSRYYLAEVSDGPVVLSPEHHDFRWVTLSEARELMPPRLDPVLVWLSEALKAVPRAA